MWAARRLYVTLAAAVVASTAFAQSTGSAPGDASAPAQSSAPKQSSGLSENDLYQPDALYDRSPHERKGEITAWVFLPYFDGLGIGAGARYTLPVLRDGFLDAINDSIELEFGGDVGITSLGYGTFTEILIPVAIRWSFHLTPKTNLYAKFGLGLFIGLGSYNLSGVITNTPVANVYPEVGIGGTYHFTSAFGLRLEVTYPAVKVGIDFDL